MFCRKLNALIKDLSKKIDKQAQQSIEVALRVTRRIKVAINNPTLADVVALTPTDVDDKTLRLLQIGLEAVVELLGEAGQCKERTTYEERVLCYLQALSKLPRFLRNAHLIKAASIISATVDGERFLEEDYDTLAQTTYRAQKQNSIA